MNTFIKARRHDKHQTTASGAGAFMYKIATVINIFAVLLTQEPQTVCSPKLLIIF